MNALLLIEEARIVLIDPGCADFLPSRLTGSYGLEIVQPLDEVLEEQGIVPGDVTDVIFTHLHFDHGSGAFIRGPGMIGKRFPGAGYHVLKEHYAYAGSPAPAEAGSYFTGLFKYIDQLQWLEEWPYDWMTFRIFNGHTRRMVVPEIMVNGVRTFFLSDLVPMKIFLDHDVYSGYDVDPVSALVEKREFLDGIKETSNLRLFHDPLIDSVFYP